MCFIKTGSYIIIDLTFQDLEHCANIYNEVFNRPPWNEGWTKKKAYTRIKEVFETPGFYGLKAMMGSDMVGFAMGCFESFPKFIHYYLKEMGVLHDMQGKGIGTLLIKQLKQVLRQKGVQGLYLLTQNDSFAEYFYVRNGLYTSQLMKVMGCRLDQA